MHRSDIKVSEKIINLIHKAIRDFRCGKLAQKLKEIHTPNHIYSESAHHGDGLYANFKLILTYFLNKIIKT